MPSISHNPPFMSEAEVALYLALNFLEHEGANEAEIALDGAQVMIQGREVFPVGKFLLDLGWVHVRKEGKSVWNGFYEKKDKRLHLHAHPGRGDVVAKIGTRRFYAECKKGPTQRQRSNPEYKLLREAIGQLMTISEVGESDILIVAVPDSTKFRTLTNAWKSLTAIKRAKINFVCVGKKGAVEWISKRKSL